MLLIRETRKKCKKRVGNRTREKKELSEDDAVDFDFNFLDE
jgi:hypothetical protein